MIDYGLHNDVEAMRRGTGGFELAGSMPTDGGEILGRDCPSGKWHFWVSAVGEEGLARQRVCDTCGLRSVVLGEHRFCPVRRKVERS